MQMPQDQPQWNDDAPEAPPKLVSALKQISKPPLFVPPAIDEAVQRAAERHLTQHLMSKKRRTWVRFVPWLAAATAILVMLAVTPRWSRRAPAGRKLDFTVMREDVNHDGQIDILDAFTLARQLKDGMKPSPQWDLNGDGMVDERDVAQITQKAVGLEKGGRS